MKSGTRTRTERLLNPKSVEDYGISIPLDEFLSDPAGLKAWDELDDRFKPNTSSQVEADPLTS